MTVIVELSLEADQFEIGRILSVETPTTVVLETLVPMGEQPVPFFRVHDSVREEFEADVSKHPSVNRIKRIEHRDSEMLYALDWDISDDTFFHHLETTEASLLNATGDSRCWWFELRFESHDRLAAFKDRCEATDLRFAIEKVYTPTEPGSNPHFGLTPTQRDTLVRAVSAGYYAIPRETNTAELAEEFGVSDQAITERLRRAIVTLTTNTLGVSSNKPGTASFVGQRPLRDARSASNERAE